MPKQASSAVQAAHVLDFISQSPAQTERIGQRIGERLRAGDLLLLLGELGAGKTQLVKGIAKGMGSEELVTSPSFVLVNEYRTGAAAGGLTIYHADLYRIDDPGELQSIGLEEAWGGQGVVLIEWAERAAQAMPADHLVIQISHLSETKRVFRFLPHGQRYQELIQEIKDTAFA